MPIKLKTGLTTTKKNRLLVIVVGFLMLTITVFIGFSFYVVEKNRIIISPLKTSLLRMETEFDEIHRWTHKAVKPHLNTGIVFIWFQLDLAVTDFRTMVDSDEDNLKVAIPEEMANELKTHLKALDSEISNYKKTVNWLLDTGEAPGNAPPDGIDYEHVYTAILKRFESMEAPVDFFLQKDMLFFRKLMVGGGITCLLLAVVITTTFSRFLKQKADDYGALETANERLGHELAERNLAEASLQQSEKLFRTVFETSPDAIIITRIKDSSIIDVNLGFTAYFGYDRGEVIGRSVLDVELWQDIEQRKAFLDEVFSTGFSENWEAVFLTKHVGPITCLLSSKKVDINGEPHLLTVARNISDRKIYEMRVQAANQFLIIGNRYTEMQPLLSAFLGEIKRVSGCAAVAVRILNEDGRIPYAAYDGFDGDFCSIKAPLSITSDKGMCNRVINNRRAPHESLFTEYGSYYLNSTSAFITSASADQTRLMRNTCNRFGYETIALIPIRSGDRTLGLIHVADREASRLNDDKVDILEAAALQLGTAIERVQAEQALKDSHDDLEKRVEKRTEMLQHAKNELVIEVEQRRKYEQELLGFQQRQRKLSSLSIQTEERERRRIATEIHDRIGQTLAVVKIQLGVIGAEFDFQGLKPKVEYVRELVSQTIRDVRTLTFELSPPMLYELGLQAALEWLAVNIRKQSGLEVEIAADGCNRLLDTDRRVLLFRTCSELLLNVVKHAEAKHARVDMRSDGDLIRIGISDDGVGFDQAVLQNGFDPFERGFGLFSIGEQLKQYGGTFTVDPAPGHGSAVTIALPLAMTAETGKGVSS